MLEVIAFLAFAYLLLLGAYILDAPRREKISGAKRAALRSKMFYAVACNPVRATGAYGWTIRIGWRMNGK